MRNGHEENPKCGRFHFEMVIAPDFDALLKLRRPKNKNIEQVRNDIINPLNKEETKVADKKNDNKSIITRPINEYLALGNKDLAKEIIKPKTIIEFNNTDFELNN